MIRPAEVPTRTFEDALYILSIEKDMPDAALLDEVIRTCPEFSEELTDFAFVVLTSSDFFDISSLSRQAIRLQPG